MFLHLCMRGEGGKHAKGGVSGGEGACVAKRGMHGGGGGVCVEGCVAGETATAANGTHPTGMHSCFKQVLLMTLQIWF